MMTLSHGRKYVYVTVKGVQLFVLYTALYRVLRASAAAHAAKRKG